MNIIIGLVVTFGCVFGGYMLAGGHMSILMQPYEYLTICGAALGWIYHIQSLESYQGYRESAH